MRGWTRRRVGKGFAYRDAEGRPLAAEDVERIRSLAIPPAWKDVWICPLANGHIQAVGTDDAGRRQYLYHPDWRVKRDKQKFDRVLTAAAHLPRARRQVAKDLAAAGMPRERAAAVAVRLLDVGYFRIGSDTYADANGSFGLTTLERQHELRVASDASAVLRRQGERAGPAAVPGDGHAEQLPGRGRRHLPARRQRVGSAQRPGGAR